MIRYLDTYSCYFCDSDSKESFYTLEKAMQAAESYCGNNNYTKPFLEEEIYLYGPGNGTTSVMVRRDVEFTASK
jgi:hypothetical protein